MVENDCMIRLNGSESPNEWPCKRTEGPAPESSEDNILDRDNRPTFSLQNGRKCPTCHQAHETPASLRMVTKF